MIKKLKKRTLLLICDLDGTLTDGLAYYDGYGNVTKSFHTRDISALWKAVLQKIRMIVLTGSCQPCNAARMKTAQLENCLYEDCHDKKAWLEKYLGTEAFGVDQVAFIGDGDNDIDVMEMVSKGGGIAGCPQDALDDVVSISDWVSKYDGGRGAVTEFVEEIIRRNKNLEREAI